MSILRYKQKLLADGGVARGGDGGGGGGGQPAQPSSTTSYNTNIPEYAQPYVTNMLNAAQAQIYNSDMTGFNPYVPYSNNPQDYFAGPSPMQQQAYSAAANMKVPGQYQTASDVATIGAGQGLNAGANYARQATNPYATQAYMSPYIQNALQPQLQEMQRQYDITGAQEQGAATRAGAFGGSREALMAAENQRNKNIAMNQAIGQGYQNAFQNAQQAQQFGANLGLQGAQAGISGANQLANIGGQQLNAQQGIANLQNTYGSQQQAQQQQIINQAIQNYATAQQYPYMQLGILNSMLRGLPMQSTTTASYQAQPSTAMQAAGLLGAAGSIYGKKEGGVIGMKEGGSVPGYRYGSIISEPQLSSMANRMDDKQLNQVKGLPGITPDERNTFDSALINNQYVRSNPEAGQMLAQAAPPPQQPAPTDRMSGIAQAGGPMFGTMGMAGGGIIAFDEGDLVDQQRIQAEKDAAAQDAKNKAPAKVAEKAIAKEARKEQTRADYLAETQNMMRSLGINPDVVGEEGKGYMQNLKTIQTNAPNKLAEANKYTDAAAWLSLTEPTEGRPVLSQVARSLGKGLASRAENIKANEELKNTAIKASAEFEAGNRAKAAGDIETASKHFDEARKLQNQLEIAQGNNAAAIEAARIHAGAAGAAGRQEEAKVDAYMKDHPGATRSEAYAAVAQYSRGETNEIARMRYADAALADDVEYLKLKNSSKPEDRQKAEVIKRETYKRYGVTTPSTAVATAPTPVQNEDGTVTIPGRGTFKKLPNGNYAPV